MQKLNVLFGFEGKRKDTSLVIMRSFQYFCEYRRQLNALDNYVIMLISTTNINL